MTAIGFIGLGRMGAPMAARLIAAGHTLVVLDANAATQARFIAAHGAQAAARPCDLARESEVVITMLPTSVDVADVLYEASGLLAGLRSDALVIEMSSGVPVRTQDLRRRRRPRLRRV